MINTFKIKFFTRFLLKLLAFLVVILFIDFMAGYFLKKFYFKQESGYDFLTTYSIEKTKADILIFGSSRAANLINPDIVEQHFNMSCFNAGRQGQSLFYHFAVLKAVLKRHAPKIVILSFDAGNFDINQDSYDRLSSLLPYYSDHPEIRPVVELKGPYEKMKMMSNIYPFNSLLLPILIGNTGYSKTQYANIKGYIPLEKVFNGAVKNIDFTKEKKLDTIKINMYKSFIKLCIDSNIKLYIVCPPYLINSIGIDYSIREAKKIAKEYNINFFDYSMDSFYTKKLQLFADFRHLNRTGVTIFSNDLIDKIKSNP